uniref:Uncharacterized protein n=1 Tax=Arundo donax TaxID=35708 RepID=A0A0A9A9J6_ARUDO
MHHNNKKSGRGLGEEREEKRGRRRARTPLGAAAGRQRRWRPHRCVS